MSSMALPSARELRWRLALQDAGLALAGLMLAACYLAGLLDLSSREWTELASAIAIAALLAIAGLRPLRRNLCMPVMPFLEDPDRQLTDTIVREAFRSVLVLPRLLQRQMAIAWLSATAFVSLWMHLSGAAGWGLDFQMLALTLAGVVSPVPIPTGQIMIMGDYFVDFFAGEKEGFNPIEAFVKRDIRK